MQECITWIYRNILINNSLVFRCSLKILEFQEAFSLEKCPDKNAKVGVNFKIKQIGEID